VSELLTSQDGQHTAVSEQKNGGPMQVTGWSVEHLQVGDALYLINNPLLASLGPLTRSLKVVSPVRYNMAFLDCQNRAVSPASVCKSPAAGGLPHA